MVELAETYDEILRMELVKNNITPWTYVAVYKDNNIFSAPQGTNFPIYTGQVEFFGRYHNEHFIVRRTKDFKDTLFHGRKEIILEEKVAEIVSEAKQAEDDHKARFHKKDRELYDLKYEGLEIRMLIENYEVNLHLLNIAKILENRFGEPVKIHLKNDKLIQEEKEK